MDPQLGRVGLTEKEARAQGRSIRVAKLPMAYVAKAIQFGETRGFMKAIVDADTNQILGCAILGMEGGEVMTVLQVAMMGKLLIPLFATASLPIPRLAESLITSSWRWMPRDWEKRSEATVPFEQGQSQQSQAAAIAGSGLAIIHSSDVERNAKE